MGDEQVAQVVGALARAVGIESLVGQGEPAGGDFAQQAGGRRTAQPVMGAIGLEGRDYRFVDGPQRPVYVPYELGRTAGERAPYATAVQIWPVFSTTGPAGGQRGHAGAAGTEPGPRAWGRH